MSYDFHTWLVGLVLVGVTHCEVTSIDHCELYHSLLFKSVQRLLHIQICWFQQVKCFLPLNRLIFSHKLHRFSAEFLLLHLTCSSFVLLFLLASSHIFLLLLLGHLFLHLDSCLVISFILIFALVFIFFLSEHQLDLGLHYFLTIFGCLLVIGRHFLFMLLDKDWHLLNVPDACLTLG